MLYSVAMVRTRRVLSFSSRVYTYVLLFNLFFYALFLLRLWMPVTPLFGTITEQFVLRLAMIGILYGAYLLILICILLFQDRIFLIPITVLTLFKIIIHVAFLISVQFVNTITSHGFIINL
jgi:hypothetical protein